MLNKKVLIERIKNLGFNPKRELILVILFNFVGIGIIVFASIRFKNYWFLLAIIPSCIVVNYLFYYSYSVYEEDKRKKLELEFLEVFSYIRIYLVNKENVYNSIKKANEFTSKEMNYEINVFLKDIDEDKSILPFIRFASKFKNKTIEEVMISLYQMIDGGFTEAYLNQFISIFENFRNRILQDNMNKRYKRLETINHMSLVGSAYLMLVMLLVIVRVIGEMANGL